LLYEKLGKIYNCRKNYNIAFDFAERKLQLDKEFNYFVGQQKAYQLLGIISYNKRHYNEALRFYKKGLKLKEIHDKVFPLSYSYFNIGLVYEKMKKYTTSLLYFDKAIDLLPQSYEKNLTMLLYERALVYRKMRRYKKARTLFTDLKNLADDLEQTKYIVLASIELNNIDFIYAVTKKDQEKLLERTENLYEIAKNEEEKKNISKVVRSMKRRLEKNENRK